MKKKKTKKPVRKSRLAKRKLASEDDDGYGIGIDELINFGPVTAPEIRSLGFHSLEDLRRVGWEDVCRR